MKEINIFESNNEPITNSYFKTGRRWQFSEKKSKIFPIEIALDQQLDLGLDKEHEFFIRQIN